MHSSLKEVVRGFPGEGLREGTNRAKYAYDALGRRVSTTIGDQTTHCVFDGQNVIAEYSPAGQLLREHFHGAQYIDERIATREINTADPSKDKFSYYLLKENFSVAAVGNADGSEVFPLDYSATGNWEGVNTDFNHDGYVDGQDVLHLQGCITGPGQGPPAASCTDADLDADGDVDAGDYQVMAGCVAGAYVPPPPGCVGPKHGQFTLHGQPVDVLPDGHVLLFSRARHYDVKHGRWLQRDPMGYADGGNLYEAYGSNPARFGDPNGEFPWLLAGAAAVALLWPPDPAVAPTGSPGEQEHILRLKAEIEDERIFFVATTFLFPLAGAGGGHVARVVGATSGATRSIVTNTARGTILAVGQEATIGGIELSRGQEVTAFGDPERFLTEMGLNAVAFRVCELGQPRVSVVEIEGQCVVAVETTSPIKVPANTPEGVAASTSLVIVDKSLTPALDGVLADAGYAPTQLMPTAARSGARTGAGVASGGLPGPGEDLYVGSYGRTYRANMTSGLAESHTPHHVVQDATSSTTHSKGVTINIRKDLHVQTRTFGRNADLGSPRANLAADVADLRRILEKAGYYRKLVNQQLRELIRQNKVQGGFQK